MLKPKVLEQLRSICRQPLILFKTKKVCVPHTDDPELNIQLVKAIHLLNVNGYVVTEQKTERKSKSRHKRTWMACEIDFLLDNYKGSATSVMWLANNLHRTHKAILVKLCQMGRLCYHQGVYIDLTTKKPIWNIYRVRLRNELDA